jgi:hypothetical protein
LTSRGLGLVRWNREEDGAFMEKILIELRDNMLANVEATSEDVEVYVFDHDVISEGNIGELKRYLAHANEPIEVDTVVKEDELVADLKDLIEEGQCMLEDLLGDQEDEELAEAEEA